MASLSTRDLMAQMADADQQPQPGGAQNDQVVSLDAVKKHLSGGPGQATPLQGYLLKRSENLRIWNQRWFSLEPTTARLEYRLQRTDPYPRGTIMFQAESTITVSPINFHGAKQYDGCCFYIGTAGKKEYFMAAETPTAARAWVNTLRASAVVLKAHREAMEAEGETPSKASMRALANATALAKTTAAEAAKDVAEANQQSMLAAAAAASSSSQAGGSGIMSPFSLPSFSLLPTPAPSQGTVSLKSTTSKTEAATAVTGSSTSISTTPEAMLGKAPSQADRETARQNPPPGNSRRGSDSGGGGSLPLSASLPEPGAETTGLKEALRAKDEEIEELKDMLRMREESLQDMQMRLEEAAVAAEKAADAAQHMGRERDRVRMEAARLCTELEERFTASDQEVAAAQVERNSARALMEQARVEIHRLRATLGAVAPALLEALGPSIEDSQTSDSSVTPPVAQPQVGTQSVAPDSGTPATAGAHSTPTAEASSNHVLHEVLLSPVSTLSTSGGIDNTISNESRALGDDKAENAGSLKAPSSHSAGESSGSDLLSLLPTPPTATPLASGPPSFRLTSPKDWAAEIPTVNATHPSDVSSLESAPDPESFQAGIGAAASLPQDPAGPSALDDVYQEGPLASHGAGGSEHQSTSQVTLPAETSVVAVVPLIHSPRGENPAGSALGSDQANDLPASTSDSAGLEGDVGGNQHNQGLITSISEIPSSLVKSAPDSLPGLTPDLGFPPASAQSHMSDSTDNK